MDEVKIVAPELPRGFRDYLPAQMIARQRIINTIRNVYELYGFQPLGTPAQEFRVTLTGYGEENTKQIFSFKNPEEEDVALRFDLTVPLARVIAQYPDLHMPFRRYQVAPVWRADKPDPGRFREFVQFDLDSVGTPSLVADVEIISAMYDTLLALGIERFTIRFSSRKVLDSLLDFASIPHAMAHKVFRILDKLEKIGVDGVSAELTRGRVDSSGDKIPGLGLETNQVERIKQFLLLPKANRKETLANVTELFSGLATSADALSELEFISDSLADLNIPERNVQLDLSIARGLDYYTGPVFEAVLDDAPEFGSVFGGGRYDGLVERFLGRKIPAVGASMGVDRLLAAMQHLGLVDPAPASADVLVTVMQREHLREYQILARNLREAGIKTELYMGEEKSLGKQLQYANRRHIPVAVIVGEDERAKGEVTVKNLKLGEQLQDKKKSADGKEREEWLKLSRSVQVAIPVNQCVSHIRSLLG